MIQKLNEEKLRDPDCPCVARTTLMLRTINELVDEVNQLKETLQKYQPNLPNLDKVTPPPDAEDYCKVCGQLRYRHHQAHEFISNQ
jgi:hypothetical protein